jgi:serine/threonine protein kinase
LFFLLRLDILSTGGSAIREIWFCYSQLGLGEMSTNRYISKQIGNYYVLAEIGRGGFGSVYQGGHTIFSEFFHVAIKLLYSAYLNFPLEQENFIRKAQLLENLKHSYILSIVDASNHEGLSYLVTEHAVNGSLGVCLKNLKLPALSLQESNL